MAYSGNPVQELSDLFSISNPIYAGSKTPIVTMSDEILRVCHKYSLKIRWDGKECKVDFPDGSPQATIDTSSTLRLLRPALAAIASKHKANLYGDVDIMVDIDPVSDRVLRINIGNSQKTGFFLDVETMQRTKGVSQDGDEPFVVVSRPGFSI